jgi:hypothetical protein
VRLALGFVAHENTCPKQDALRSRAGLSTHAIKGTLVQKRDVQLAIYGLITPMQIPRTAPAPTACSPDPIRQELSVEHELDAVPFRVVQSLKIEAKVDRAHDPVAELLTYKLL